MSENITLDQPRKTETSLVAVCSKCKQAVYNEVLVERYGKLVERVVTGSFRQAIDEHGMPTGPVVPFCNCGE